MLLIKNKRVRQVLGVLETANYLGLKLLWKNPSGLRTYPGKIFRDYMSLVRAERWKSRSIFELLPDAKETRITLECLPGEGISTPMDELAYLAFLTRHIAPRTIFEIGTFRGRTALNFALNAPDDCVIYTVDLPQNGQVNQVNHLSAADAMIVAHSITGIDYRGKDVAHKIRQLYGNSMSFDFSPYYARIDLVFVDGAHHYQAVKSDTLNALRLAKPGGFIVWHDFANYGDYNDVTRGILDSLPGEQIIQIDNSQLAVYRKPVA